MNRSPEGTDRRLTEIPNEWSSDIRGMLGKRGRNTFKEVRMHPYERGEAKGKVKEIP